MENNDGKKDFLYSYSAKEQAELKRIREKYTPATEKEDKMEHLRRLDASVTQTATAVSLVIGILVALILGFGMSLCMTDLAESLGFAADNSMQVGIMIGVVGGILASVVYPIYNVIVKHKRAKIAPEVIRLTDELMK